MTSNTLIKRINEVRFAVKSYKNANILKDKKLEIESFITPYREICNSFDDIKIGYKNLKNINVDIEIDFLTLSNNINYLKQKVNNDEFDRILLNTIKKDINNINSELKVYWRKYIREKTSAIDGVLESLGELIDDMPEKILLQEQKNIFSKSSVGEKKAVAALVEYRNIYDTLMSKLNLSENVLEFIKSLTSSNKVTLFDLTPEVFEWIKSSEFAKKITLNINSKKN